MLISSLLNSLNLHDECEVLNEKEFDCFARATTIVEGKKCIFLVDRKYIKNVDDTVSMVMKD